MDTKLLTGAGGFLLLAATIFPSALGHDERPALAIPYGGDPDGVSGRYVGAAGPALAVEAGNQSHPAYAGNAISRAAMLCDAEVVVDSDASPEGELNEDFVDGYDTISDREDLVDDGGQGGACHAVHYTTEEFNTPGCQGGQTARASNGVSEVWIGAACDWKTPQGSSDPLITLEFCLINGAVAFDPEAPLLGEAGVIVGCVERFVDCLFISSSGCVENFICGADGTFDAIDHGHGSGGSNRAVFPAATGVTNWWPPGTTPCALGDEVASIFVFDTVATNGGSLVDPDGAGPLEPVYVLGSVTVHPALTGELWTDL